jgi:tRNA nucleotidyltransferase (CCA-adding enzyme)
MIGHRQKEDPTEEMLREWWKEMPIKQMKELVVSGRDLLEQCGGTGGPWVGKALRHLFEQVALGNLPNRKEVLVKEGCRFGKVDSQ